MKKVIIYILLFIGNYSFLSSQDSYPTIVKCWIFNEFSSISNDMTDSSFILAFKSFDTIWDRKEIFLENFQGKKGSTYFKFYKYSIPINKTYNSSPLILSAFNCDFIVAELFSNEKSNSYYRLDGFKLLDFSLFSEMFTALYGLKSISDLDNIKLENVDFKNLRRSIKKKYSNSVISLRKNIVSGEKDEYYFSIVL